MVRFELLLSTPEETSELGRRLGNLASPGLIFALIGPLGSGKTTLVRAIAEALGADPQVVASPTFALVHEYPGRLPIYHFDVYRLPDLKSFVELGIEEYFQARGVCLIEWADRVEAALPADHLRITMAHEGEGRRVVMEARGKQAETLLDSLIPKSD